MGPNETVCGVGAVAFHSTVSPAVIFAAAGKNCMTSSPPRVAGPMLSVYLLPPLAIGVTAADCAPSPAAMVLRAPRRFT